MGAATKGRSTGKASKGEKAEGTGRGTSRGAPRTDDREVAREADRGDAAPTETNGIPTTSDGAITAVATSSQQAAEQRQQVDAPAVVAGEATAKQADEAKAMALPEVPQSPATSPGLEQREVELSRQRAHLIGEQARLTSDVGTGTSEAGKPQVRTFARLQVTKAAEPETVIEHTEVAIPIGDRELVFRENFGGHVELLWNDPGRINAMRGGSPFSNIAMLTPDQVAGLRQLLGKLGRGSGDAPEGQSAAEQRKGVAEKGGDPGPAAPLPVFAR
jgi:hypothetical protein